MWRGHKVMRKKPPVPLSYPLFLWKRKSCKIPSRSACKCALSCGEKKAKNKCKTYREMPWTYSRYREECGTILWNRTQPMQIWEFSRKSWTRYLSGKSFRSDSSEMESPHRKQLKVTACDVSTHLRIIARSLFGYVIFRAITHHT